MECSICKKNQHLNHSEVYRNNNLVVSHAPLKANILGYFYIEPLNHYEDWSDIPIEVLCDVQIILKKIDLLLKREQLAERVYSITISEMVKHIHFHIIPRHKDTNFRGISLIKKATQQIGNENDELINDEKLEYFIKIAKRFLSE